ncbi:3-carboxy-cis,cis-muconate cycloisomerase [Homoserinimonas aerilata]|uniref:3-carboxy-cis,cis-muconate cycloisomerase n=1 Tax=Homoserinimonas aerilata TaxID=1162970 RepID=A0A542YAB4_9MICO|nr:lyase family protein [Homoserinimonas aerilata]TQL45025.1 3-carboxy-cis,cis-muconate cycloisomerase [Homoserinimonas aerilata]
MIDESDSGMLSPGWANTNVNTIVGDRAWIEAALEVEAALARCQGELGIIPREAAATIEAVAGSLRIDPRTLAVGVAETSNPAITLVQELQRAVERDSPGASDHVHLGATSQDVLDSATMLVCRRALFELDATLSRARANAAQLIARHGDAPMAGRTVTQHAVPMTFGVKVAAWLNALVDAQTELGRLLDDGLPLSLAGASGTLAAYAAYGSRATNGPFDPFTLVDAVAEELALDAHYQPWHTVRTPIARIASTLTLVSGALGKIASDVHVMSRTEIAEVVEGLGDGGGISSSMPQKLNPVRTVLVLSAARQVPSLALVLHQAMLAEDERSAGAWQSEWQPLRDALRLVLGSASHLDELLATLRVDEQRMRANLDLTGPAIVSERLNVALTPLIGKLQAKHVLRRLLLDGSATGEGLVSALQGELTALGVDPGDLDLERLLDPADYLGASAEIARRALLRSAAFDD